MSNRNKHAKGQQNGIKGKKIKINVNKEKFFDRMAIYLPIIISLISLWVAWLAMYTSNALAINNSALNFSYEQFSVKPKDIKEGIEFEVSEETITQGSLKIRIDVKVISGQIASLYLIQNHKEEFVFTLLNDGEIQNKSSKVKSYETDMNFDMQVKGEYEGTLIGSGWVYVLSEDMSGQVFIDAIQIVGPVFEESANGKTNLYVSDADYEFNYIKNNKLVTIHDDCSIGEGWISYRNVYPSEFKTINVEELEHDLETIKEIYSRYKY